MTRARQNEDSYHLANILFAGACNQRCPYCIGQELPVRLNCSNLDVFPPRNLDSFTALVREHNVPQLVLTGANTDPQLYHHERRLILMLREQLPGVQLSLHTNGQLALAKMDTFNMYDKATISFPSFVPETFAEMTGTSTMPDLTAIIRRAQIPVKISSVLTEKNAAQTLDFLALCARAGIRRVVLRRRYGDRQRWNVLAGLKPTGFYHSNPVYTYLGVEVTYWRFEATSLRSLNLFADGSITAGYLLTRHGSTGRQGASAPDRVPRGVPQPLQVPAGSAPTATLDSEPRDARRLASAERKGRWVGGPV